MRRKFRTCLAVACLAVASPAVAQEPEAGFPFGSVVVLLPVQSARVSPGGSWPGGARTEEEAVRAMDAEIEFALEYRRGAEKWALANGVRDRLRRNPLVDVDPDRLAYDGLIRRPDPRDQIYEPLHGQLRSLAALFGTRFIALPIVLSVGAPPAEASDTDPAASPCAEGESPLRAELLMALIDIRRSAVLWHGTVSGPAVCPGSGGMLAGLADALGRELAES